MVLLLPSLHEEQSLAWDRWEMGGSEVGSLLSLVKFMCVIADVVVPIAPCLCSNSNRIHCLTDFSLQNSDTQYLYYKCLIQDSVYPNVGFISVNSFFRYALTFFIFLWPYRLLICLQHCFHHPHILDVQEDRTKFLRH